MHITESPLAIKELLHLLKRAAQVAIKMRNKGLTLYRKKERICHYLGRDIWNVSKFTNGDEAVQKLLERMLPNKYTKGKTSFPIYFLGEEDSALLHDKREGYWWIVDPIDGTTGYANNNPETLSPWAISIALQHNRKTMLSLVYLADIEEYDVVKIDHQDDKNTKRGLKGSILWSVGEGNTYVFESNSFFFEDDSLLHSPIVPLSSHVYSTAIFMHSFFQDRYCGNNHLTHTFSDLAEELGLTIHKSKSAVFDACQVIKGEIKAYIGGILCPWDSAAIKHLLAQANSNVMEYTIPEVEEKTLLFATYDKVLFDKINTLVLTHKAVEKCVFIHHQRSV